ncbi:hypothetical protein SAMN05518865_11137 [Duganella sp. CF458]|uniref:hypothetical protein n=1 Tax=Duganella sp. CF458 TaxID=1884368 RepID=UPI0008DF5BC8|nr:hypothetical protein [Duganella sp. CF458]SFG35026.1 hypothetical protein SAMN05518865_11137 [Duganella sp. CF458]
MEYVETLENLETLLELKLMFYEEVPRIDHPGIRIAHACENIARHIRSGDREAARIGCRIIVRDPHLPFGKIIKSGIARALRQRIDLVPELEQAGLVKRTTELLSLEFCPRETEDYCKLVKKIGPAAVHNVTNNARATDEKSQRLLHYMSQPFSK